ncbi:MAG: nucleotidyltransferase domain-containing protein [Chloroflexi bacterium]|nr:nucleotidyltransferase domain-containing protein [Chloroflexota bacterium]
MKWIRSTLRWSGPRVRKSVLAAYIVGSEARGTARPNSDLDIAVVITPVRGKTPLQFSDYYHQRQAHLPEWNGRNVDFQFFYPDDMELVTYSKIPIES